MTDPSKLKMYILVADDVPLGHAINSAAHASLACYLTYQDVPLMQDWVKHSFRKVTCKVTREQLAEAVKFGDEVIHYKTITESALNGTITAVAICPKKEWPAWFATLPLYK